MRLDRTQIKVQSFAEAAEEERQCWFSKTPEERLQMTEYLRQMNFGYDPAGARLQRVFEIVERKTR